MRTLVSVATSLLLLGTVGLTTSLAASGPGANDGRMAPAPLASTIYDATAPAKLTAHKSMKVSAGPMHRYRPRLSFILARLDHQLYRISVDRHHGYLTKAEARIVLRQERAIRASAMRTAARDHGILSRRQFANYREEVQDLSHHIHRLATNA